MATRITKEKTFIRLSEESIKKLEHLVSGWTYDTKAFVRSRLNQYKPSHPLVIFIKEIFFLLFFYEPEKKADECSEQS